MPVAQLPERVPMIEDDPKSVKTYIKRIEETSKNLNYPLKIEVIQPDEHYKFLEKIDWAPKLILVDYDLAKCKVRYSGKSVAGLLDDYWSDIPRILTTRKSIAAENPEISFDIPFDALIFKKKFRTKTDESVLLMVSLIRNFQAMTEFSVPKRKWSSFLDLLSAKNREIWEIQDCSPPVVQGDGSNISEAKWNPHTLTKWVRGTLFKYPGILLDSLHASSYLGIRENAFIGIKTFFSKAAYEGVYADLGEYWWRGRLGEIALDLILSSGYVPDIATSFSKAFLDKEGIQLDPSICCTSQEPHADQVCYILKKPVKNRYSFIYRPDPRPKGMNQARVSFKAVRNSDKLRMDFLEDDDRKEAQALMDSAKG